jgi:hypothetical protein
VYCILAIVVSDEEIDSKFIRAAENYKGEKLLELLAPG